MRENWPTKEQDLRDAFDIMDRHYIFNDCEALALLDVVFHNKDKIDVQISDWVVELDNYFAEKYGANHGKTVTNRVLTKLMLIDKTVH